MIPGYPMDDTHRIAGVLGGLGPDATVHFMARVLELTPAESDQDHVRLIVDQNPQVPNRQRAILGHAEESDVRTSLADMAAGLERAGADFLVMPCNAAHAFADDIVAAVQIPFVSIIDATLERLPEDARRVGVLETPACRDARLYGAALDARGIVGITLDDDDCRALMELAYRIKVGERGDDVRTGMQALAEALVARGADALIAGCTEIPLVLEDDDVSVPLLSSTDALALRTIALARGEQALPA